MNTIKNISCDKAIEIALLRTSHEAGSDDIRKLEVHLRKCPSCKREVDDINMSISSYRTIHKPHLPDFARSHIIEVVTGSHPAIKVVPKTGIRPKILKLASSAVATAAVIMFAFIGLHRPTEQIKTSGNIPSVEAQAMNILAGSDLPSPEAALVSLASDDITAANAMLDILVSPSNATNGETKHTEENPENLDREIFNALMDA